MFEPYIELSIFLDKKVIVVSDNDKSLSDTLHPPEIEKMKLLTDEKIENIVNKIPDELMTKEHKKYIIYYLKRRRDILLSIK